MNLTKSCYTLLQKHNYYYGC